MKKVLKESGLRDISALRKRYPKAEIYFHQDLDGVTTAIAMKKYLEDNGIQVVGAHIIQYGDKEFAVKKNDAQGDVMPVLVDFAHGKPMFKIHTDHHDRQVGAEKDASKSFRQARSNVETISQIVSPKDIFPSSDILLISTVDSADFARQDIKPEEVVNYVFRLDKEKPLQKNKMLLGFVINKLILAFKNRQGFMEELVMDSEPSLMSILTNIKKWMKETNAEDVNKLQGRSEDYLKQMKNYPKSKVEDGIIFQYGAGSMKTGSYDRYTPFRVNPDADFLVIMWPLGLLQASCNPFKKERKLKGVNLGEIAQEVLKIYEPQLKNRTIPLSTLKWISEISVGPESVGFTFQDFDALYGGKIAFMDGGEEILKKIKSIMDKPFSELSESEKETLDKIGVNMWDFIQSNSGGHKCITNISGLNYLGRKTRPSEDPYRYSPDKPDVPYIKFMKQLGNKFVEILKEKIKQKSETITEEKQSKRFVRKGHHDSTPGIKISLFENNEKVGHSNLLNYDESKSYDGDITPLMEGKEQIFDGENCLYLHDLWVNENFRGKGKGKKLLEKCEKYAKSNGKDYVTLITSISNKPAVSLYEKSDYKVYNTNDVKNFYFKKL